MAVKGPARTLRKNDLITDLSGEKYFVDVPFVEHPLGATHSHATAFNTKTGEKAAFPLSTLAPSVGGGFHVVSIADNSPEMVDHPAHYGGDGTYEVFKVAEAWGLDGDAYLFTVLKYIARAGKKDPTKLDEDLRKARNFLTRRIDHPKKS